MGASPTSCAVRPRGDGLPRVNPASTSLRLNDFSTIARRLGFVARRLLRPRQSNGEHAVEGAVQTRSGCTFTLEGEMSNERSQKKSANRKGRVLATALVALFAACGGDGGMTTPSVPTAAPAPPAPVVVAQSSGSLPARYLAMIPFTTTQTGTIDVTVDWTFASNDVDVYLARGACSFEEFVALQCQLVAFSESTVAKPEKLSVPNAVAGGYTLLIGNLGPGDESVAFQVVLTPALAPSTASPSSVSGREPARSSVFSRGVPLQ